MTQLPEKRFVACPFSAALELAEKAAHESAYRDERNRNAVARQVGVSSV